MQASDVKAIAEKAAVEVGPEAQETAARLTALMRHLFLYDRGNQLRVIEESGLSMTQCKALLELGGLGQTAEAWQVGDLAEVFGVSVPSMSRAVDALVKKRAGDPGRGPRRPARAPGRRSPPRARTWSRPWSPSARPASRPSPRPSAPPSAASSTPPSTR